MSMYNKGNPYEVQLKAGDSAYLCQCGYTKTSPFCDGSHSEHPPIQPHSYTATNDESIWVCGCGKSDNKPFCDGSHNNQATL